jgi:Nitroreductase family.
MSTTGKWVAGANFAVVVLTNAEYPFHLLDAGQAIMSMMLAAWNRGVASRIFTGFDQKV